MERGRMVGAGLAGGLGAGAMVGAAEALAVWFHAHGAGETPALGWAVLAYGLSGGAGGLGLGVVAAIVGIDGFALAFAAVGVGLAGVVGRFRVIRDVFLEQLPSGLVPLAVQGVAALMLLGIAVALWRALSGVAGAPPLPRPTRRHRGSSGLTPRPSRVRRRLSPPPPPPTP